jgi:hypothetical protein
MQRITGMVGGRWHVRVKVEQWPRMPAAVKNPRRKPFPNDVWKAEGRGLFFSGLSKALRLSN